MFAGRVHAQEVVNIKYKDLHRLDKWYRGAVSVSRFAGNAAYLASFPRSHSRLLFFTSRLRCKISFHIYYGNRVAGTFTSAVLRADS